ncbi:MAG: CBS domain-containing protein [Hyphomicrobiaceae bacterium]|nr:CBS domain-containing protein [Hyphomicrobiaceae bacterium]
MRIREILNAKGSEVSTVRADLTIGALAQRLRDAQVGAMVVTGEAGGIEGIVTERDVVYALAEHGGSVASRRVALIMSTGVVTCTPEATVSDVARTMTHKRIRHMPVTQNGELVGIVSIGDILKNRLDEVELEANVLRDVAIAAR